MQTPLDSIHHVAIEVQQVAASVAWYRDKFRCEVDYEDETWALLRFANTRLALVSNKQHPPHIGFTSPDAARYGVLKTHRDGTKSIYIADPSGNSVELLDEASVAGSEERQG